MADAMATALLPSPHGCGEATLIVVVVLNVTAQLSAPIRTTAIYVVCKWNHAEPISRAKLSPNDRSTPISRVGGSVRVGNQAFKILFVEPSIDAPSSCPRNSSFHAPCRPGLLLGYQPATASLQNVLFSYFSARIRSFSTSSSVLHIPRRRSPFVPWAATCKPSPRNMPYPRPCAPQSSFDNEPHRPTQGPPPNVTRDRSQPSRTNAFLKYGNSFLRVM